MKAVGRYLFGIIGTLSVAAGTAYADRTMVVLLDASGSMTITRSDGATRYEAAKEQAALRVQNAAMEAEGLAEVAVYKFHDTGIEPVTTGFVSPFQATMDIMDSTVTPDLTPLAGSLCDSIDIARTSGSGTTTARLLEVYSDGEENNTSPSHPCFGPYSTTSFPYDGGSWQQKVYAHATEVPVVTISTTLFTNVAMGLVASGTTSSPEDALLPQPSFAGLLARLSDAEFFADLAAATGGASTIIADSQPLPVFADLDGDYDVDRDDAIALARQFGAKPTHDLDLDADGSIGWADYALLLAHFGEGSGTPSPDPYTAGDTVTCGHNDTVVIDGQVIENEGITIDTQNKCTVVIRNSLIVSGGAAIRVRGSGTLTVDSSIIVGEGAWVSATGRVTLSASRSIFHGAQTITGTFKYTDRGGNVFE